MKEINLGSVIYKKRKEKKLTQEELAEHLGVSKPAVSKWESGQSYPDITLLPVIASYFNISLDELMGYDPQMVGADIRKLYLSLAEDFASQPFEQVYRRCLEICHQYYACWELLYQMGTLLLNHANLAPGKEQTVAAVQDAIQLFRRVRTECANLHLARQALYMEAACHIALGDPVEAIDLLEDTQKPEASPLSLLAVAYQMKGDAGKATALLQRTVYQGLMTVMGDLGGLVSLYAGQPEKAEECLRRALAVGEIFSMDRLFPSAYFPIYLFGAGVMAAAGKNDRALDLLEQYTALTLSPSIYPLELKGDAFFDRLGEYIAALDLEANAPRSQAVILRSLREGVTQNPVFASLQQEERFQRILKKLEQEG